MAQVYSTRFYSGRPAARAQVLYTVPAAHVAVVRSVQFLMVATGATLALTISDTGASIVWHVSAAATEYFNDELRAVVNAGESLTLAGGNGAHQVTISGYLFSL